MAKHRLVLMPQRLASAGWLERVDWQLTFGFCGHDEWVMVNTP